MRRALLLLSLVTAAFGGLIARGEPQTTSVVAAESSTTTITEVTEPPSTTTAPTTVAPTTTEPPTTTVVEMAAAAAEPEPEEVAPEPEPATTTTRRAPARSANIALQPCGGDLPPCEVARRESGGDYNAYNARGCGGMGCRGKWQFDPPTWGGYAGVWDPRDASPEDQDERARQIWDGGKGCRRWSGPTWNGCMFV